MTTTDTIRPGESRTYIDITEVAKLVRKTLKTTFGPFKFSVKSSRYAGGSSITVSWTDGPTTARVEALIGHFCGADFDGMTDSKSYHDAETMIAADGSIRHIHYGNDYIFTNRSISEWERKEEDALAYIRQHCKIDGEGVYAKFGNEWVCDCARRMVYAHDALEGTTQETAFRRGVLRESA